MLIVAAFPYLVCLVVDQPECLLLPGVKKQLQECWAVPLPSLPNGQPLVWKAQRGGTASTFHQAWKAQRRHGMASTFRRA